MTKRASIIIAVAIVGLVGSFVLFYEIRVTTSKPFAMKLESPKNNSITVKINEEKMLTILLYNDSNIYCYKGRDI
ncbi:MAG: hypothetical protein ACRDE8_07995, partial [Ginsengibacter sp.]